MLDQSRHEAGFDRINALNNVAERWKCSVDTIKRLAARGELKLTRLSTRRLGLRESEERRFLDSRTA